MQQIFTGPRQQAALLARMLRAQHIDAVMMFTEREDEGAVHVRGDIGAGDQRTIERAIEQSKIEYNAEGGAS